MNDRRAHIVVAVVRLPMLVLLERDLPAFGALPDYGEEGVRLWDLFGAFKETAPIKKGERLPRAVRTHRFNGSGRGVERPRIGA
jgi:hypothetical protein